MEKIFKLTEKPVFLEKGTDGSAGIDGDYVLFGDWPQSLKGDDVSVDEGNCFNINGWDCFSGSDGAFYVKVCANPSDYGGECFFSNGEAVSAGKSYFFRLESIKWRVLDNNFCDGWLLFAENILTAVFFDSHYVGNFMAGKEIDRSVDGKAVHGNNYEFSGVRAFLNGLDGSSYDVEDFRGKGFLDFAFSKDALENIMTVSVDTGALSMSDCENNVKSCDDFACNNTFDKVFLLSEREITNKEYGFDSYKTKSLSRFRKASDYSRAVGAYAANDSSCKGNGEFWLRSPVFDIGTFASAVGHDGCAYIDEVVSENYLGIVPAIVISEISI